MAVQPKQTYDALTALAAHFKGNAEMKAHLLTLVKARPSDAEMPRIKSILDGESQSEATAEPVTAAKPDDAFVGKANPRP